MANNLIEEKMDSYLSDLKSVEKALDSQLTALSNSIDASFGAFSVMIKDITDMAVESTNGFVSNQTRSKIGAIGAIVSKTASMAGNVYKAKKHNEALDKLLITKREMAEAKSSELKKIEPIVLRVHDNLKKGLMNEGSKVYPLKDLDSKEKWTLLLDRMDKYLDMYRTSIYMGMVISYLQAEYQAWLSGQQTSYTMRPDYYAANVKIVELLEQSSQEKATSTFIDVFEKEVQTLSGSTIYYLMDSQLSGTVLSMLNDTYSLSRPANAGLKNLIKDNKAIEDYIKEGNELEEEINAGPSRCYYSYTYTIAAAIVFIFVRSYIGLTSGWYVFLAFIIAFIVGRYGSKRNELLAETHKYNVYLKSIDMKDKSKDNAGHVDFPKMDLEKKSLIKAAFVG